MAYRTARLELTADELTILQDAIRLAGDQLTRSASWFNRSHRIADINVVLIKLDAAKQGAR